MPFKTLKDLKNLKRLGVEGVQSRNLNSALLITKEITQSQPEPTSSWTYYPLRILHHLKQLVGLRTLKTGLAIFLALLCANLPFISTPFYVAMGTVFALQSTVKNSFTVGRERIVGAFLGGSIGFLFSCLPWQNFFLIACAAILTIVVCNQTKNTSAVSISITICLSILISIRDQNPLTYSFFRITDTAVGLSIGILVNYFVARPNYFEPMKALVEHFYQTSLQLFEELIHHRLIDLSELKNDLKLVDDMARKYLEDSVLVTLENQTIQQLLEHIHDLRFYLKALHLLLEEGYEIEGPDQLALSDFLRELPYYPPQTPSPKINFRSDVLISHHLEKTIQTFYQIQMILNQIP